MLYGNKYNNEDLAYNYFVLLLKDFSEELEHIIGVYTVYIAMCALMLSTYLHDFL